MFDYFSFQSTVTLAKWSQMPWKKRKIYTPICGAITDYSRIPDDSFIQKILALGIIHIWWFDEEPWPLWTELWWFNSGLYSPNLDYLSSSSKSAWAVITKYYREGGLNRHWFFPQSWRLEVQDQGSNRAGFWWGLFSQFVDCPSSHTVLTWPLLCAHVSERELSCPFLSLQGHQFYRTPPLWSQGVPLVLFPTVQDLKV